MTLLVRDEEDILDANFDFHLAQGVDCFIVTDNLSVDGTPGIIADYARRGLVVGMVETQDNFAQHRWVTRMAQMAAQDLGADWVINSDADEFWMSAHDAVPLRDHLSAVSPATEALLVPRADFLPVAQAIPSLFAERMIVRERVSRNANDMPLPPKVCHRARADIEVAQGNHAIARAGTPVEAHACDLQILHFPMRTYAQFENKIARGGAAYARNRELPVDAGGTWRKLYRCWQQGTLPHEYACRVRSPTELCDLIDAGTLLRDERVRDLLRKCRGLQCPPGAVAA